MSAQSYYPSMQEIHKQTARDKYPETADIETSSNQYANRFSGPAGKWMLKVQEKATLAFVNDVPDTGILDVGGGHGQLTIPLCNKGHKMTVLGSDASCAHRIQTVIDSNQCTFIVGNVIALPFTDSAFGTVICFRLLTHCERWHILISELCRVASESVIVDYPVSFGLNAIAPMLFGAKKKLEGDTRTWRLFRRAEIINAFRKNGFEETGRYKQFFFPMVLHRTLKYPKLSAFLETAARLTGLTAAFGSPVISRMSRKRN